MTNSRHVPILFLDLCTDFVYRDYPKHTYYHHTVVKYIINTLRVYSVFPRKTAGLSRRTTAPKAAKEDGTRFVPIKFVGKRAYIPGIAHPSTSLCLVIFSPYRFLHRNESCERFVRVVLLYPSTKRKRLNFNRQILLNAHFLSTRTGFAKDLVCLPDCNYDVETRFVLPNERLVTTVCKSNMYNRRHRSSSSTLSELNLNHTMSQRCFC